MKMLSAKQNPDFNTNWCSVRRAAAELLIQEFVKDGNTVSLGSGRLVSSFGQSQLSELHFA